MLIHYLHHNIPLMWCDSNWSISMTSGQLNLRTKAMRCGWNWWGRQRRWRGRVIGTEVHQEWTVGHSLSGERWCSVKICSKQTSNSTDWTLFVFWCQNQLLPAGGQHCPPPSWSAGPLFHQQVASFLGSYYSSHDAPWLHPSARPFGLLLSSLGSICDRVWLLICAQRVTE